MPPPAPSVTPARSTGFRSIPTRDSSWSTAFANKNTSFEADGAMNLDARALFYFNAGGVTPAMAVTRAGAGSDYAHGQSRRRQEAVRRLEDLQASLAAQCAGERFLGRHDVRHADALDAADRPEVPDRRKPERRGSRRTRTARTTSISRPKAPKGKEGNWLQTVPGKSWFALLRMYGPLRALDQQDLATERDRVSEVGDVQGQGGAVRAAD